MAEFCTAAVDRLSRLNRHPLSARLRYAFDNFTTRADDFIVSNGLVSLTMSQLAENPGLRVVFDDLFDEEGSEVYLKPANGYVVRDTPVDFYTVVESARRRGEVAIGYRLRAHSTDPAKNYGVVMNPDKSAAISLGVDDRVIVLAEG